MKAALTGKQKTLTVLYPALMKLTKWLGKNSQVLRNSQHKAPAVPLYSLPLTLNNGQPFNLQNAAGKKLLLVNTASNCGYTAQYAQLQQLQERYQEKLVVIGFPANDFKEQEKGNDADIAQFCQVNFGVTFPLAKKSKVVKGEGQNEIFYWLSNAAQNGWNNTAPTWNFSKYLVDESGHLTHYFDPSISPLDKEVVAAIG